jgi:hypothetical protein
MMGQPTAEILLNIGFRDIAKWVRSDPTYGDTGVVVSGERIQSIYGRSKQTGTRGFGRDRHNSGFCQLLCFVAIFQCEPDGWRAAAAELSSNSCRPTGLRRTSSRHDCHNGASGAAGLHGFATVPEAVARGPVPRFD